MKHKGLIIQQYYLTDYLIIQHYYLTGYYEICFKNLDLIDLVKK